MAPIRAPLLNSGGSSDLDFECVGNQIKGSLHLFRDMSSIFLMKANS